MYLEKTIVADQKRMRKELQTACRMRIKIQWKIRVSNLASGTSARHGVAPLEP